MVLLKRCCRHILPKWQAARLSCHCCSVPLPAASPALSLDDSSSWDSSHCFSCEQLPWLLTLPPSSMPQMEGLPPPLASCGALSSVDTLKAGFHSQFPYLSPAEGRDHASSLLSLTSQVVLGIRVILLWITSGPLCSRCEDPYGMSLTYIQDLGLNADVFSANDGSALMADCPWDPTQTSCNQEAQGPRGHTWTRLQM